ncbi:cupin domain-containing protein [Chitinophaga sp. 22536]|uniref:cupin domain-containing protein n=1 Tax=unclassified Chitinophaga TaxID=2619133 RepID=UPI003F825551
MQNTVTPASIIPAGIYRQYNGGYFRTLVSATETQGNFSLIDISLPKGVEPPTHMHTREDETFYLLEGEITFHIGEQCIHGKSGDSVFAPRMVPHHFALTTPTARFLTLITPGHFLDYFVEFSTPCTDMPQVSQNPGMPPPAYLENMARQLTQKYGVLFL